MKGTALYLVALAALVCCAVFAPRAAKALAPRSGVVIAWLPTGLASIRYGDHEFLSFGQSNLSRLELTDPEGHSRPADLQSTVSVKALENSVASSFSWGALETRFTPTDNELNLAITIRNKSPQTITGLSLEPLRLRMDRKPSEYDGTTPLIGDGGSTTSIIALSTTDETVVLSNSDPGKPLNIGFPWAINRPVSTEFPLRIVTGREVMYPDRTPLINRPIPPGGTDVYHLTLTFGDAQPSGDLVAAIYRKLINKSSLAVNWPDRRPIGAVVLATSNAGFAMNPRGWFLDRSLNVFDKRGRAKFCSTLIEWANNSIAILHRMNAQGAITWDIEGEQYPHATTYIGDPRLIDALAPEMSSCVDNYFNRFTLAGFKIGVTIRPQQLVRSDDASSATQQPTADPEKTLNDKIMYAKQRWGASLFYIDSNGDPNFPMDPDLFRKLHAANPDVLLIPEHSNIFYYGATAPYGELRRGVSGTSALVRNVYAGAFRVINVSDGPVAERLPELKDAVQAGDVLMFRTWFADPVNELIRDTVDHDSRSSAVSQIQRSKTRNVPSYTPP